MNDEIIARLKEIKIEDYIWIVYLGIIFLSYYSNSLERDYFLNKNEDSKERYRIIMIIIFSILVIVYYYFLKESLNDLKNIYKYNDTKKEKVILSFLGSLLIFISGIIFLYLAIKDEDLDVELAFN
jgi:uncharacterized membrane protein